MIFVGAFPVISGEQGLTTVIQAPALPEGNGATYTYKPIIFVVLAK